MLTPEQRAEFERRGFVRLRAAIDPGRADELRRRIVDFVAERRLVPDPPPPHFVVRPSRVAKLVSKLGFEAFWGEPIVELLHELLGRGAWLRPANAGQLLAMPWPQPRDTWPLPHKVWHLDYPAPGALEGLPGLQLFLCVDRIEPRAGATLAIAGSHRLIDALRRKRGPDFDGRSAEVRKALNREVPWLRELWSLRPGEDRIARFMAQATPNGDVELQVAEFTGEPGDVIAMHPWMVHSPAANCGARPRLALTARVHTPGGMRAYT